MRKIIILLVFINIFFSCSKEEPIEPVIIELEKPLVSIESINMISYNSATINYKISSTGGAEITETGIIYGKESTITAGVLTPTNTKVILPNSNLTETLSKMLSSLENDTSFKVWVYAENSEGISYSESNFTTIPDAEIISIQLQTQGETVDLEMNGNEITGVLPVDFCYKDFVFEYELSDNAESLEIETSNPLTSQNINDLRTIGINVRIIRSGDLQVKEFILRILPNPKSAIICETVWEDVVFSFDETTNIISNSVEFNASQLNSLRDKGFFPSFNFLGSSVKVEASNETIGENYNSITETDIFNINDYDLKITSLDGTVTKTIKYQLNRNLPTEIVKNQYIKLTSFGNDNYILMYTNSAIANNEDKFLLFYDKTNNTINKNRTIQLNSLSTFKTDNHNQLFFTLNNSFYKVDEFSIARKLFSSSFTPIHDFSGTSFIIKDDYIYISWNRSTVLKLDKNNGSVVNEWNIQNWFDTTTNSNAYLEIIIIPSLHKLKTVDAQGNLIFLNNSGADYCKLIVSEGEHYFEFYEFDITRRFFGSNNGFTNMETLNSQPTGFYTGNFSWYENAINISANDNVYITGSSLQGGSLVFFEHNSTNNEYVNLNFPSQLSAHVLNLLQFQNNKIYLSFQAFNSTWQLYTYDINSNAFNQIPIPTEISGSINRGDLLTVDSNNIIYSIIRENLSGNTTISDKITYYDNGSWATVDLEF
jgi:hypothetical protein